MLHVFKIGSDILGFLSGIIEILCVHISRLIESIESVESTNQREKGESVGLPDSLLFCIGFFCLGLIVPSVTVLVFVAVEEDFLPATEIGQELRLTFDNLLFARGEVLLGVVTHAEHDVLELLGKIVDKLHGAVVAREQVDIDSGAIVGVHAVDMQEDNLRTVAFHDARSEFDIGDTELLEVHLAVVINVTGLV